MLTCRYSDPLSAGVARSRMPLAPRLAPLASDLDLLHDAELRAHPCRSRDGAPCTCRPMALPHVRVGCALALVALDVEALAAHGHDQSVVGERGQGPLGRAV